MIRIKRVYEAPAPKDGFRVLVDRLWPRGVSKDKAKLDEWMKDIAPSDALRQWYSHDPAKWPEFKTRYKAELAGRGDILARLKSLEAGHKTLTLLFAAKDAARSNAAALAEILSSQKKRPAAKAKTKTQE
ncbi:MAG TPA: DUF488 family protein [Elusimicrobiota bacterium]|nr:DUF488 family protein [Elusimicrobiota bacterium]